MFVRSRQHDQNERRCRLCYTGRAFFLRQVCAKPIRTANIWDAYKPSAFGNVCNMSKQKKPLRDNDLTDSIQVIS